MSSFTIALIVGAVTISAVAQILFKLGLNSLDRSGAAVGAGGLQRIALQLTTPGVLAGLGLYVVGTLLWLDALSRTELSLAYPFVGLGFALTTLAGWWLFGDHLTSGRIVGIALIVIGISIVSRS